MMPKMATKRTRKYRTNCNAKNLKLFAARVSAEVHDFFEIHSYDEKGRKLSKGKVLEMVVAAVGDRLLKPSPR